MLRKESLVGSLIVALATLTVPGSDLAAQRGHRGAGTDMAATALRLADELNLSAEQRADLESLRLEILEDRQARVAELLALRSDIAAGHREREAMRSEVRSTRQVQQEKREAWQAQFSEILSDEQEARLKELRPNQRGRAHLKRRGQHEGRGRAWRRDRAQRRGPAARHRRSMGGR